MLNTTLSLSNGILKTGFRYLEQFTAKIEQKVAISPKSLQPTQPEPPPLSTAPSNGIFTGEKSKLKSAKIARSLVFVSLLLGGLSLAVGRSEFTGEMGVETLSSCFFLYHFSLENRFLRMVYGTEMN